MTRRLPVVLSKRVLVICIASILFSSSALAFSSTWSPFVAPKVGGNLKVVKILDNEGKLSFEVLDDEIIRLMKKDLSDRYKAAKRQWNTERKNWKDSNPDQSFVFPKPISPKLTVVKKGFDSRSEAESVLDEIRSGGPFCIYQVEKGKEKTVGIVKCDEFPGVKYAMEKAYHDSVIVWLGEKNGIEKGTNGDDSEHPEPAKVKVRILKNKIKTMDKAESLAVKYT